MTKQQVLVVNGISIRSAPSGLDRIEMDLCHPS